MASKFCVVLTCDGCVAEFYTKPYPERLMEHAAQCQVSDAGWALIRGPRPRDLCIPCQRVEASHGKDATT